MTEKQPMQQPRTFVSVREDLYDEAIRDAERYRELMAALAALEAELRERHALAENLARKPENAVARGERAAYGWAADRIAALLKEPQP